MASWIQQESPKADYLRSTCDHLLQDTASEADSDQPTDLDGLLGREEDLAVLDEEPEPLLLSSDPTLKMQRRRAFFIRTLALLCACSLSIGSH
jgi:hypothetical protein